ncbi:MAG: prenyltransferase/squalene oxidase repeat-containing protein [Planctomycetota bacterium]
MLHRPAVPLVLAALGLGSAGIAQESVPPGPKSEERALITPETRRAIDGALRWLADHQNKDGSWTAFVGFKINDAYRQQPMRQGEGGLPHLGVTALAAMAFMSGGHQPGQGPYGDVLDRSLAFVLDSVKRNGFITRNGTRMYSHAFSVLFLAEVYGMTGNPKLREKLERSVEFTYKSQNDQGGWRYAPLARDSDMSITVCQVVALREARNVGMRVPKKVIDKALSYVMQSAVTVGTDNGGFLYQHDEVPFNRNSFALTAAGLTTMFQAGLYTDRDVQAFCREHGIEPQDAPRIHRCLEYLEDKYGEIWTLYRNHYFYFYGNYYAAQAWYTRGGSEWRRWYRRVRDDLLGAAELRAGTKGPWVSWRSRHVGRPFSTAIAAIILQVPRHYLPIFQR